MENTWDTLYQNLADQYPQITIEKAHIVTLDIKSTFEAVENIMTKRLPTQLSNEAVVVDITQGLKTLSVGVALACTLNGWRMTYWQSRFDPTSGRPVDGTQHPVMLDVDFLPGKKSDH